jgi:hypothetical protein
MKFSKVAAIAALSTGLFAIPSDAQSPGQGGPKTKVLSLPLKPEGFASRAVTVKTGFYLIEVVNRSGVKNLNVQIDIMPGTNLSATAVANAAGGQEDVKKSQFLTQVHLTPGTYRVSITGHPTWVCAIDVD